MLDARFSAAPHRRRFLRGAPLLLGLFVPGLLVVGGLLLAEGAALAQTDPEPAAKVAPTSAPSRSAGDPFVHLRVVTPREKLTPLASVRVRDKREAEDRSRKGTITVSVGTSPKGASVYYNGKLLGTTPLGLSAQRGSTPIDVVIRRGGYMTLRTRLMRKVSRGYFFKLTPAKLH